jgi:hypothetical protein
VLGIWSFSGAWNLELGFSATLGPTETSRNLRS